MKKMTVLVVGLLMVASVVFSAHNLPSETFENLGVEAIPQIIEAIRTDDENLKVMAIRRLGDILKDPAARAKVKKEVIDKAVNALTEALQEGNAILRYRGGVLVNYFWRVRVEAAFALAKIGDERAVKPLVRTLRFDRDLEVRRAAARALGDMKAKGAVRALIEELEDTMDNSLANEIVIALGKIGDKAAFVPLLKVIQGDYLDYVKENAQKAIENLRMDQPSVLAEENATVSPPSQSKK